MGRDKKKRQKLAAVQNESIDMEDGSTAIDSDDELDNLVQASERKVERHAAAAAAASSTDNSSNLKKKKKKPRWKNRKSVFVNQIPYAATVGDITKHFAKCAAQFEVRQVMDRKSGKFRGVAFIDFESDEGLQSALAMDQSSMTVDGSERLLNVREAVAKGEGKTLTPVQAANKVKVTASRATIEQFVATAVTGANVQASDFDERAMDFLCTVPEDVAQMAIGEFQTLDMTAIQNRWEHKVCCLCCSATNSNIFCYMYAGVPSLWAYLNDG